MQKKIIAIISVFFILLTTAFAANAFFNKTSCAQAVSSNNPAFCSSFKSVAICHCSEKLPAPVCQDMDNIYQRMIGMFGSVDKACQYQKDTSYQICMDDWSCYRNGGKNSLGQLCSATGKAC